LLAFVVVLPYFTWIARSEAVYQGRVPYAVKICRQVTDVLTHTLDFVSKNKCKLEGKLQTKAII